MNCVPSVYSLTTRVNSDAPSRCLCTIITYPKLSLSLFLLPTSKKIKTGKLFTSSSRFFISQKHKHAIKWLHVCIKQTAVSSQGALAETTRGRLEMIS